MLPVALALVAFCVMEPVAYLAHRFVMHGVGDRIHRSHHRARTGGWQANDLFPATFASVVLGLMILGYQVAGLGALVAVGTGISAYGTLYALVHDVYIHRRVRVVPFRSRWLERLADAHRIHHLYGGEPYGMLVPIVPAELRARAATSTTSRDALGRAAG